MAKKYTLMFFDVDKVGKVRTYTLSRLFITSFFFIFTISILGMAALLYHVKNLHNQRDILIMNNEANNSLKLQLENYTKQISDITAKINEIDSLEYQIKDLLASQSGYVQLKPIAVGGKEVDLLRAYSTNAAISEKDFFDTLDDTLKMLSYEVSERELRLPQLASKVEENKLVLLHTPTIWPVDGWLSSPFGFRVSPFTNRQTFHEGIDIAARPGANVIASAKGVVIFAGHKSGYGQMVVIDHKNGYITKYGHNSSLNVQVGDKVEKGQAIAKVGSSGMSTGPHLHYEVLVSGIPVDPLKYILNNSY